MKQFILVAALLFAFSSTSKAQQVIFDQTFENLEEGVDILKLKKGKFATWGKGKWTVSKKKKKGNNKSNKFATSDGIEGATLVQYANLEVGETYEFSVAVKITNAGGVNWKTNYTVKVTSGKKGDIHEYGSEILKEPGEGSWKVHKMKFTVVEGRERVTMNVYRWAKDIVLNIDDFKLVKL